MPWGPLGPSGEGVGVCPGLQPDSQVLCFSLPPSVSTGGTQACLQYPALRAQELRNRQTAPVRCCATEHYVSALGFLFFSQNKSRGESVLVLTSRALLLDHDSIWPFICASTGPLRTSPPVGSRCLVWWWLTRLSSDGLGQFPLGTPEASPVGQGSLVSSRPPAFMAEPPLSCPASSSPVKAILPSLMALLNVSHYRVRTSWLKSPRLACVSSWAGGTCIPPPQVPGADPPSSTEPSLSRETHPRLLAFHLPSHLLFSFLHISSLTSSCLFSFESSPEFDLISRKINVGGAEGLRTVPGCGF